MIFLMTSIALERDFYLSEGLSGSLHFELRVYDCLATPCFILPTENFLYIVNDFLVQTRKVNSAGI